ncbi:peptide/nickel transport system permease protein [Microbacterium keratanolyticum]|uniref:ABC transporter permease n=1 Tax=Microbacterium keratanolyticum TaxID=67574 RepID=UPI0019571752|nr:ABC transporter permease [Microbacterium keratanolyticum]MBM7468313.1 peptide/nickel transport system permease protein [Microbacterium keratanolyticum]
MTTTAPPPVRTPAGHGSSRVRRVAAELLNEAVVLLASLLAASIVIFALLAVLPGDQAAVMGGMDATPEQLEALRTQLGLDRPLWLRYLDWIGGVLSGDLGTSALDGRPVAAELGEKLQVTIPLGLLALLLSVVIAVPLGVIAAVYRESAFGRSVAALSQLSAAVPTFVLGLLLVVLVALPTRLFPVQGFPADRWADPGEAMRALILPATAIAIGQAAVLVRFVRSATIDVLMKEWVRTGLAQGWPLRDVLLRQGLRNAALPLLGVLGLEIAGILMGSVIVEQLFALPGVGGMILADVGNRDIVSIQSTLFVLTALVMISTVTLTALSRVLDPRIRRIS